MPGPLREEPDRNGLLRRTQVVRIFPTVRRDEASEIAELKAFAVKLLQGYGHGGDRDDPALQPGTDRGQGQQAQACEAFNLWARKVRSVEAARALRGELRDRTSRPESVSLLFIRFS